MTDRLNEIFYRNIPSGQFPTAYYGQKVYALVVFCKEDEAETVPVLEGLERYGCRLRYDVCDNVNAKESSVFAPKNAEWGLIVIVSETALMSKSFRKKLNYALECEKPVIAVFLEDMVLSAGMQMEFSALQCIHKYKYSFKEFMKRLCDTDMVKISSDIANNCEDESHTLT